MVHHPHRTIQDENSIGNVSINKPDVYIIGRQEYHSQSLDATPAPQPASPTPPDDPEEQSDSDTAPARSQSRRLKPEEVGFFFFVFHWRA